MFYFACFKPSLNVIRLYLFFYNLPFSFNIVSMRFILKDICSSCSLILFPLLHSTPL